MDWANLANGLFALGGSLITGVLALIGSGAQRRSDADQADKQRQADADEREAQRAHESEQRRFEIAHAQLQRRRESIARWRRELSEAHRAWTAWDLEGADDTLKPRVVGETWFEELRVQLNPNGGIHIHQCITATDNEIFDLNPEIHRDLSLEIGRLERQWEAEAIGGGR